MKYVVPTLGLILLCFVQIKANNTFSRTSSRYLTEQQSKLDRLVAKVEAGCDCKANIMLKQEIGGTNTNFEIVAYLNQNPKYSAMAMSDFLILLKSGINDVLIDNPFMVSVELRTKNGKEVISSWISHMTNINEMEMCLSKSSELGDLFVIQEYKELINYFVKSELPIDPVEFETALKQMDTEHGLSKSSKLYDWSVVASERGTSQYNCEIQLIRKRKEWSLSLQFEIENGIPHLISIDL